MNAKDLVTTHSQFNFTRKPLLRPTASRQFSREKSQPTFNPTKFRIHQNNNQLTREKLQKTGNNFFNQHNNTAESTKLTRAQNQSLLRKHDADKKQQLFDQEDREEELQFVLLCETFNKIL